MMGKLGNLLPCQRRSHRFLEQTDYFPNCVTSDRVIFTFDDYDNYKTNWYYLILDQENPELVPMCSIEFDI